MKNILKHFGTFLMILGGVLALILLMVAVPILKQELSLASVAVVLLYLALFCGLFYLGSRLRVRGEKTPDQPREVTSQSVQAERAASKGESARTTPAAPPAPSKPLPAARPAPAEASIGHAAAEAADPTPYIRGMDRLCLCKVPQAHAAAGGAAASNQSMPEEIYLDFQEGTPVLVRRRSERVETGKGRGQLLDHFDTRELPAKMRAGLTAAELKEWILAAGKDGPVRWDIVRWDQLERDLAAWCLLARERAKSRLPEGVYAVACPFLPLLGNRMRDDSGIIQWLRLREGADLSGVIHDLGTWGMGGPVVLLTEDAGLLRDLSGQDLELCFRAEIRLGRLTTPDCLTDLVTLRRYRVQTQSQSGPTDDSETHGRWYLSEREPSPESRTRVLGLQIVSDCRRLGVDAARIKSLMKAELQMTWPSSSNYTFTYDAQTRQYRIWEWERGNVAGGIEDTDEREFRFRFQQSFVYYCESIGPRMRSPERVAAMLCDTKELFGDTKSYQAASEAYRKAFPDAYALYSAWDRVSEKIAPLADAFHFRIEYDPGQNQLLCVFRDKNLPNYRIHIETTPYLLSARGPLFRQEWELLNSYRSLTNAILAMIWHAAQCGASSNILGEQRYNGEAAFLDQGKLEGPLYTEDGGGQYQVTMRRAGEAFQVGFYADIGFILSETKGSEEEARISASVRVVVLEYFLSTFDALVSSGFVRRECKRELCLAFMFGRLPEERFLWPPLRLSRVRTVEDTSRPGAFGQQDTRTVEIARDEAGACFLRFREHSVTSGSNGRPETMDSTVCYPLSDAESVGAENWRDFAAAEHRIVVSVDSFCGI